MMCTYLPARPASVHEPQVVGINQVTPNATATLVERKLVGVSVLAPKVSTPLVATRACTPYERTGHSLNSSRKIIEFPMETNSAPIAALGIPIRTHEELGIQQKVAVLISAWNETKAGLEMLAKGPFLDPNRDRTCFAEDAVKRGLDKMIWELDSWKKTHMLPQHVSLLVFAFPRSLVGRELYDVIKMGVQLIPTTNIKRQFVEIASRTATALYQMAITPQEEALWKHFQNMELEKPTQGLLGADSASFGKHLHLKGGINGSIQVMQDWEWPYMYALADLGFELVMKNISEAQVTSINSIDHRSNGWANANSRIVRVLEVGWGQGISGRRLLGELERIGAARDGVSMTYEVIELHPIVAQDARREAACHPEGRMQVHEGPWQRVVPCLPDCAYDLIFYDPYELKPSHMGETEQFEKWGLPICVMENLLFYRLLRPGGVIVQYAIAHGCLSASDLLRDHISALFSELKHTCIRDLVPEVSSVYATKKQANSLDVSALIK